MTHPCPSSPGWTAGGVLLAQGYPRLLFRVHE